MKKNKFPENFKPYKKLVICSNELYDGGQLVMIGEEFPIVIGQNANGQALVWLEGYDNTKMTPVISASKSSHPLLRVDKNKNRFTAFIGSQKVIDLSSSENMANVDFLDLRLLGFEIYGDDKKLMFARNEFSDNKFYGSIAMIAMPPLQVSNT